MNTSTFQYLLIPVIVLSTSFLATGESSESVAPVASEYQTIASGPLRLSIDPKCGGRLASFTYEGKEILRTQRDPNNWHWGSTVWTSPQKDWNWPPIGTFDQNAFQVVLSDGNQIEVTSEIDPATQLQLTKQVTFRRDSKDSLPVAVMTYTLTNRGNQNRSVALWENTRVRWAGSIEFPVGGTMRTSNVALPVRSESVDGHVRIVFDKDQPNAQKIFCTPPSNSGDTYSTYRFDGLVFTKTRKMPSRVAPDQSPLEIYLAPKDGFAELENQGDFQILSAGQSMSMTVEWALKPE